MGPGEGRDAESVFSERGVGHAELEIIQLESVAYEGLPNVMYVYMGEFLLAAWRVCPSMGVGCILGGVGRRLELALRATLHQTMRPEQVEIIDLHLIPLRFVPAAIHVESALLPLLVFSIRYPQHV